MSNYAFVINDKGDLYYGTVHADDGLLAWSVIKSWCDSNEMENPQINYTLVNVQRQLNVSVACFNVEKT